MIIRSFRVRFLLWNVLISGMVLAVFAAAALCLLYRGGLHRLDGDLKENARREFHNAHRFGLQEEAPHLWRAEYGGGPERLPMALVFRERAGTNILLKTDAWPEGLAADTFADPLLPPDPPHPPGDRGGLMPPSGRPMPPPGRRPPPPEGAGHSPPAFERRPPPPSERMAGPFADLQPPPPAAGAFATIRLADGSWRFGVMGQHDLTVIIGVPLEPLQDEVRQLGQVLLVAFLPGLLLIAAAGWFLTGRALHPVQVLTRTAESITAHGLDQRLPVTRESREFQRLSDVFNGMLDRLEKSFRQATRFSADAAHELKTPLTVLQGQLEESLREAEGNPAQQRLYADLLDEVQRLKGIVRKLLLLSLADAGELRISPETVDMKAVAKNAAEDAEVLAPELNVEFAAEAPAPVTGDPVLLAQVVQNLVDNAIKYNREDGFVRLQLETARDGVRLAVTSSGPPIAPEAQPRIFERFYRGDPARGRQIEGSGLGLSLSREIARAHGGDLMLERSDAGGTVFVLHIPREAK